MYASEVGVTLNYQEIAERTKNGGAEVIGLKGATFYGIAMAVSNIVETIMKDDNALLPVAHVLDDSFEIGRALQYPFPAGLAGTVLYRHIRFR